MPVLFKKSFQPNNESSRYVRCVSPKLNHVPLDVTAWMKQGMWMTYVLYM